MTCSTVKDSRRVCSVAEYADETGPMAIMRPIMLQAEDTGKDRP